MKNILFLFVLVIIGFYLKAQEHKTPLQMVKKNHKYWLVLPDSTLGRYISVVNLISKSEITGNKVIRGKFANSTLIQFKKKGPNSVELIEYAEKKHPRYFDLNKKRRSAFLDYHYSLIDSLNFIDVSRLINCDTGVFSFAGWLVKYFKLGSFQKQKFYVGKTDPHAQGIDIELVQVYALNDNINDTNLVSVRLNCSMFLLPKFPMKVRYTDDRVTVNSSTTRIFKNADGRLTRFQNRYRLEPKDEDIDRYLRGELVDPKQPIIYYIDPKTPEKLLPYFIKGVDAWRVAFESAGFKNAIKAQVVSNADSSFNILSSRYNKVIFSPVQSPGATADSFTDLRSGEMIGAKANIPDLTKSAHEEYMVLAGAADTGARSRIFSDELTGELFAKTISHEVGHTLGIHHNFLSSSNVPVKKLRDKKWVEQHGISPSVMDYSRYNYVAQREDGVGREGLISSIGDYDRWAIEWLYRWYPGDDPKSDQKVLTRLTNYRLKKNKWLSYLPYEYDKDDARLQSEDIGDDPIEASKYGIKNLMYIVPNLLDWTRKTNGDVDTLLAKEVYERAVKQYREYIRHVGNLIGGTMIGDILKFDSQDSVRDLVPVSKPIQKKAVYFLNNYLFETPVWLIENNLVSQLHLSGDDYIMDLQKIFFQTIFGSSQKIDIKNEVFPMDEVLKDFESRIFSEFKSKKSIESYKQKLQLNYLTYMVFFVNLKKGAWDKGTFLTDMQALTRVHLQSIQKATQSKMKKTTDRATKDHLAILLKKIDEVGEENLTNN
ncbi:zinc-dependent metalloprotease [Pedobacter heparinus]|uniref:zinc-dependent metalloprotease n=1 Tax=Pedobacter heparinus TaxID=984 RepID=UPI0029304C4B|nr:zinc-dependent metalloprotease [Pedobacter heparinus]